MNEDVQALHSAALSGNVSQLQVMLLGRQEAEGQQPEGWDDIALAINSAKREEDDVTMLKPDPWADIVAGIRERKHVANPVDPASQTGIVAHVDALNEDGRSALHLAAMNGHLRACYVLIQVGADVNVQDGAGKTPLYWAVWHNDRAMVKFFLDHGADVNVADCLGNTVLHVAVRLNNVVIFNSLKYTHTNRKLSAQNRNGWTPCHLAAFLGRTKILNALLQEADIDVHLPDQDGATPLHCAAVNCHVEATRLLLSRGASCNAPMLNGCTPLHVLLRHVKPNDPFPDHMLGIARSLIEFGADVTAVADGLPCPVGFLAIAEMVVLASGAPRVTGEPPCSADQASVTAAQAYSVASAPTHATPGTTVRIAVSAKLGTFRSGQDDANVVATVWGPANVALAQATVVVPAHTISHRQHAWTICFEAPIGVPSVRAELTVEGSPIHGSPCTVPMMPPEVSPHHSVAYGAGLYNAQLGDNVFTIRARNQCGGNMVTGGDTFHVGLSTIFGALDANIKIDDNDDGTYTVHYNITDSGVYNLDINCKGSKIKLSPFVLDVAPTYLPNVLANYEAGRALEERKWVLDGRLKQSQEAAKVAAEDAPKAAVHNLLSQSQAGSVIQRNQATCVHCRQRYKEAATLPCGHLSYCGPCAASCFVNGTMCSVCSVPVEGYVIAKVV